MPIQILSGGVWADGSFSNSPNPLLHNSPNGAAASNLSQWFRLVPDPKNRNYLVAKVMLNQYAYVLNTSSSSAIRSEVQETSTGAAAPQWGTAYTFHWRHIVPVNINAFGMAKPLGVSQAHDVAAGIVVARAPTLIVFYGANGLSVNHTFNAADPTPTNPVVDLATLPGEEFDITLQVLWADGVNVPAGQGYLRLYKNDTLIYSLDGKNTYEYNTGAGSQDDNCPYQMGGIYGWDKINTAWVGNEAEWYNVAQFRTTALITPAQCREYVDARLAANPIN